MVAQTNDTDHHQHVRRRYIALETDLHIRKVRAQGGGMVSLTREEILDIMIKVMSDKELHLRASKGYKYTGTNNAFDGTEDKLICREAGVFWRELGMRKKIDDALEKVEERFKKGDLPWNYKTVMGLMKPSPPRGKLDKLEPGQEDEATPDPDGVPYEVGEPGDEVEKPGDGETRGCGEGDDADEPEFPDDFIPEFDAADWIKPPKGYAADSGGGDAESRVVKGHHGDGELRECGDSGRASLSKDEADSLLQHSNRLQSLQRAKANVQELGGSLGASLSGTIDRVLHTEVKMYNQRTNFSAVVEKELRESLDAEERHFRKQRTELQDIMGMKTEKKRVAEELAGVKEELKKARTAQREGEHLVELREVWKTYTPEMLGQGKKGGGGADFVKRRMGVLNRIRQLAPLSLEQQNDWNYFTTSWDRQMAEYLAGDWPEMFCEHVQHILDELRAGNLNALSIFMNQETQRVLGDVAVLRIPGKPADLGDVTG